MSRMPLVEPEALPPYPTTPRPFRVTRIVSTTGSLRASRPAPLSHGPPSLSYCRRCIRVFVQVNQRIRRTSL